MIVGHGGASSLGRLADNAAPDHPSGVRFFAAEAQLFRAARGGGAVEGEWRYVGAASVSLGDGDSAKCVARLASS